MSDVVDESEVQRELVDDELKKISEEVSHAEGEEKKKKKKKKKKKSKKEKKGSNTPTPSSSSTDGPFNLRDTLDDDQKEALDKIKANIDPELKTDYEKKWCNEMCYVRYLRARDFDVKKSTELLRGSLQWRREYKPQSINCEDVTVELKNEGKMYRNGKDKRGRPVLYMKPGKDNTGAPEKDVKVKYLVYLMEHAARSCDESKGVDKFVWLVDMKDYNGLAGVSMGKISKECLDILQNHYPERLGVMYLVNAPWVFGMFYRVLSPFLTESTKSKLKIVKNFEMLHEAIDLDQLEKDYGGTNDFVYNFEKHHNKEDLEFPPILEN